MFVIAKNLHLVIRFSGQVLINNHVRVGSFCAEAVKFILLPRAVSHNQLKNRIHRFFFLTVSNCTNNYKRQISEMPAPSTQSNLHSTAIRGGYILMILT